MVENLPTMQETWDRSLGREDPLEEEMATHYSIFAWSTLLDYEVLCTRRLKLAKKTKQSGYRFCILRNKTR